MAVCLDYQSVYSDRRERVSSVKVQLAAAVLLLVILSGRVWIKIATTDVGYELAKARESAVQLDMEHRDLNLQRSILFRSDQLTQMAKERLGMQPFDVRQVTRIRVAPKG